MTGSLARGHFEAMRAGAGGVMVSGWILNAEVPTTAVRLIRNDTVEAEQAPEARDDVGQVFGWIPHARVSGFHFTVEPRGSRDRLAVVAYADGREIGRLRTTLRADLDALPTPPPALMARVAGMPDPGLFKADGLRSYTEFVDALARHRSPSSLERVLDWGCGCGRVTVHALGLHLAPRIFGCDIDGEAIAWCQQALPGADFRRIDPDPPTPYADGLFDLVLGYSVFTHLDQGRQKVWLAELRRVLAPGGLLLASVHGRFAASFAFPTASPHFLDGGFFDAGEDQALARIAPPGYYRGVFQTREYTERTWAPTFDVLEYVEGGMQNYQDLVVARRRD
jgi:SAM-dependent methyltransferase